MKNLAFLLIPIVFVINTNNSLAQRYLKLFDKGIEEMELKYYSSAVELFTKTIKINPDFSKAYYKRAKAYSLSGLGSFDDAYSDLSKAIELEPNNIDYYTLRARFCYTYKHFYKALNDYNSIILIDPNLIIAYRSKGVLHFYLGEFQKAIDAFSYEIGLDSSKAGAFFNRALSYDSIIQFENAIVDYSRALELDSTQRWAYLNKGRDYYSLRQYKKAVTNFKKALEQTKDSVKALIYLTLTYYNLNDKTNSLTSLQLLLQNEPLLFNGMKGIIDLEATSGYSFNSEEKTTLQSIFSEFEVYMKEPEKWSVKGMNYEYALFYKYTDFEGRKAIEKRVWPENSLNRFIKISGDFTYFKTQQKYPFKNIYLSYVDNSTGVTQYADLSSLGIVGGGTMFQTQRAGEEYPTYLMVQQSSKLVLYFEIPIGVCDISLKFENIKMEVAQPCE